MLASLSAQSLITRLLSKNVRQSHSLFLHCGVQIFSQSFHTYIPHCIKMNIQTSELSQPSPHLNHTGTFKEQMERVFKAIHAHITN
jgi:hypothetical protein